MALTRACEPGHLTASCLLWDDACERILLHHHRKLDLWLQFGGHCDGDGDVRRVAQRETREESGIEPRWMSARPVDYDIHSIPARPARGARPPEPEHLHLDVRFTAVAPPGAMERLSDESLALAWLLPEEGAPRGLDDSLLRIIDLGPPATDWVAPDRSSREGSGTTSAARPGTRSIPWGSRLSRAATPERSSGSPPRRRRRGTRRPEHDAPLVPMAMNRVAPATARSRWPRGGRGISPNQTTSGRRGSVPARRARDEDVLLEVLGVDRARAAGSRNADTKEPAHFRAWRGPPRPWPAGAGRVDVLRDEGQRPAGGLRALPALSRGPGAPRWAPRCGPAPRRR